MSSIIEIKGYNIFTSYAECWVNPVNCVGIMGKGLALQFKLKFPQMFSEYKSICMRNKLYIGVVHIYNCKYASPRYICNFPTKTDWRLESKLSYIEIGLEALYREVIEKGITSIAIPPLGCGLGGLDYKEVKPLILNTFKDYKGEVELYIPR